MFPSVIESLLYSILSLLITQFRGQFRGILIRVADKLNDKIEGTTSQIDDLAKDELVGALEDMIAQLKVEGVDGPVDDQA